MDVYFSTTPPRPRIETGPGILEIWVELAPTRYLLVHNDQQFICTFREGNADGVFLSTRESVSENNALRLLSEQAHAGSFLARGALQHFRAFRGLV